MSNRYHFWPLTTALATGLSAATHTDAATILLDADFDGTTVTETSGGDEIVRALDRKTGRELWRTEWPGSLSVPFFAKTNGDWIRSTPACDGESLYVAGIRDVLVCLDVATGAVRWRIDFPKEVLCVSTCH